MTKFPSEKTCFKCKRVLARSEFYSHSMMNDGKLGKCKDCTKSDVHDNYVLKRAYYQEYDRLRNLDSERKEAKIIYQSRHRARYPDRYKARELVGRAVKSGLLKKSPCEVCGIKNSEAHHEDYSKPLEVVWLCRYHHREKEGRLVV